jgi:hypothetical protein
VSRLLIVVALAATPLAAAQDFTHRGAIGLTVAGGGEYLMSAGTGTALNGFLVPTEIGGTYSLTEHTELCAVARVSLDVPKLYGAVYAGIRNSRGERVKTFFDLDLAVNFAPVFTVGLRLGFGVQVELHPNVGLFSVIAVQGGGGAGLRLSFELLAGLQFRTYVLGG